MKCNADKKLIKYKKKDRFTYAFKKYTGCP